MPTQLDLIHQAWHHAIVEHHKLAPEAAPALPNPSITSFTARLVLNPTSEGGKTRPTPEGEYRPVLYIGSVGEEGHSCRITYEGQLAPGSETVVQVSLLSPIHQLPDEFLVWESRVVGKLYT